jgi:hypothetical protein
MPGCSGRPTLQERRATISKAEQISHCAKEDWVSKIATQGMFHTGAGLHPTDWAHEEQTHSCVGLFLTFVITSVSEFLDPGGSQSYDCGWLVLRPLDHTSNY